MVILKTSGHTQEIHGPIAVQKIQAAIGSTQVETIRVQRGRSDLHSGPHDPSILLIINPHAFTRGLEYNARATVLSGRVVLGDVVSAYAEEVMEL